jgi:hypothetical protein
VLLNESTNNLHISLQGADGSFFVVTDEAAISLHVCTKDRSELTFEFFWEHGVSPQGFMTATQEIKVSQNLGFGWIQKGL